MDVVNPSYMAYLKEDGGAIIHCKKFNLGPWNMDTTAGIGFDHGLGASYVKIIGVQVVIFKDTLDQNFALPAASPVGADVAGAGISGITAALITISRVTGGLFDSVDFDDAVMNRGYAFVWYME